MIYFPLSFSSIVKPGQRQVITLKRSFTLLISTFVSVKNSSEGFHLTIVPFGFGDLSFTFLSEKTPSINLIYSDLPSLKVETSSQ